MKPRHQVFVTISRVAEVVVVRLCASGHAGPRRKQSYACQSQDKILGVRTCLGLIIAPDQLPQSFLVSHSHSCPPPDIIRKQKLILKSLPIVEFCLQTPDSPLNRQQQTKGKYLDNCKAVICFLEP